MPALLQVSIGIWAGFVLWHISILGRPARSHEVREGYGRVRTSFPRREKYAADDIEKPGRERTRPRSRRARLRVAGSMFPRLRGFDINTDSGAVRWPL